MKTNRRTMLALTATAATAVSAGAVVLVSFVPDVTAELALAGVLAGGSMLSAFVAYFRRTAGLVTFAMFMSLLPLILFAGEHYILIWTAAWAGLGVASKHLSMQQIVERVERVTSSRTLA